MPDSHRYLTCRKCVSCHCHDCVMQEREVKRQAVQALVDDRAELREQVARLEADNTQAWQDVEKFRGSMYALEERVCRLRAALEQYGRHEEGCARSGLEFKLREEDYPCTCGLAEALKGAEEMKG